MHRRLPIFYSAMLLTGVNLILRGSGTGFQIFLSKQIGAEGIGLLQLVMSVGSLCLVAGMAGIRTASMYLSAEELGRKRPDHIGSVLSGCIRYSILFSCAAALLLIAVSGWTAQHWIGKPEIAPAIVLYAAFLPGICLCGVLSGYFTAEGRILFLAMVEIGEQIVSISTTAAALLLWAKGDSLHACQSVILGNGAGALFCLVTLSAARMMERRHRQERIPVTRRILNAALPLAAGDLLRAGIGSAENLMVPKRLARNPGIANPLAAFGLVTGMVFPIVMFPACILFGLCEILIPEMARCHASGQNRRIHYLFHRSLWAALIYGGIISGFLLLCADTLSMRFYGNHDAGFFVRLYAPLVPMLYCDAVTDAMTKGLGQQKVCVRYNITTSALDVAFLFLLLPKYGLYGYFFSFLVTHALNFLLSIRRLLHITRQTLRIHVPLIALSCCWGCALGSRYISSGALSVMGYFFAAFVSLYICRIIGKEDILWIKNMILQRMQDENPHPNAA